jgi:WD40-like Beta Propeller Repeat
MDPLYRLRTTMMGKRRADGASRISAGIIAEELVEKLPKLARFIARAARSVCCGVLASLSACTLLDEPFEPELVSERDAGGLRGSDVVDAPLSESATPIGGATEAAEGTILDLADSSCSSAIALVDPGAFVGAEPDAGGASAEPSLSLPPCAGELGAFGLPERITGLDLDESVFGPSLSSDGRTLYFSAYVAGDQQIYSATRGTRSAAFSSVTELPVINSPSIDGTPFITDNGERLYFFSDRPGGVGNRDIWVSRRQADVFSEPELVAGVNSPGSELLPWLSADELTLIFVSGRPGGTGSADLWRSSRASAESTFGVPTNVFELSSEENDGRVVLSADGLTAFFSSDRNGGRGGSDIWMASRDDASRRFSPPENLSPLNTDSNEQDVLLSSDQTELFFASSRRGGVSELWRAARSCS